MTPQDLIGIPQEHPTRRGKQNDPTSSQSVSMMESRLNQMQESKNELSKSKLQSQGIASKAEDSSGVGEMFGTSIHFSVKESEISFNSATDIAEMPWGVGKDQSEYKDGSILKEKYEKLAEGKPLLNENEEIVIILKETETFTLLNYDGLSIGNNHELHDH